MHANNIHLIMEQNMISAVSNFRVLMGSNSSLNHPLAGIAKFVLTAPLSLII